MRKTLMLVVGLALAMTMAIGVLLGFGSAPRRSVAYPNFACAVVLNTYSACVGPPTSDR